MDFKTIEVKVPDLSSVFSKVTLKTSPMYSALKTGIDAFKKERKKVKKAEEKAKSAQPTT